MSSASETAVEEGRETFWILEYDFIDKYERNC